MPNPPEDRWSSGRVNCGSPGAIRCATTAAALNETSTSIEILTDSSVEDRTVAEAAPKPPPSWIASSSGRTERNI